MFKKLKKLYEKFYNWYNIVEFDTFYPADDYPSIVIPIQSLLNLEGYRTIYIVDNQTRVVKRDLICNHQVIDLTSDTIHNFLEGEVEIKEQVIPLLRFYVLIEIDKGILSLNKNELEAFLIKRFKEKIRQKLNLNYWSYLYFNNFYADLYFNTTLHKKTTRLRKLLFKDPYTEYQTKTMVYLSFMLGGY